MADSNDLTQVEPLFRASKRQRVFRRRDESPEASIENGTESTLMRDGTVTSIAVVPVTDSTPQLSTLLRQRKPPNRRTGIAFSNGSQNVRDSEAQPLDLVLAAEEKPNVVEQASRRFTAQTGQVADIHDKHM